MKQDLNTLRPKTPVEASKPQIEQVPVAKELQVTKEVVSGSVEGITEGVEAGLGEVSEKQAGVGENKAGSVAAAQQVRAEAIAIPTTDVMVTEIIQKIEFEILNLTKEEVKLKSSPNIDFNQLNEVVKRKRNLNGILAALKNVASAAKDYIVGLWKEYVLPGRTN